MCLLRGVFLVPGDRRGGEGECRRGFRRAPNPAGRAEGDGVRNAERRARSWTMAAALGFPAAPGVSWPGFWQPLPPTPPDPMSRVPAGRLGFLRKGIDARHPIAFLGGRHLELGRGIDDVPASRGSSLSLAIGGEGRGSVGAASAAPPTPPAGRRAMGCGMRNGGRDLGPWRLHAAFRRPFQPLPPQALRHPPGTHAGIWVSPDSRL